MIFHDCDTSVLDYHVRQSHRIKIFTIICCIVLLTSACMSFPSYEVDSDLIEVMPRDVAIQYINENQTFQRCIWTETGVRYRAEVGIIRRPEPVFRSFDENRFRYTVTKTNMYGDTFWSMTVRINVPGKFAEEICTIADVRYGMERPFRSEEEVVRMVSALESLGIEPEWTNR